MLNSLPCHLGAVGSGKSLHPDPSTSPEVVRGLFSNFPALVLRIQGHHALPHSLKLGAAMRLSLANKWKCASLPAGSFSSWLVTVRGCSFCPRPEGRTQTLQNRASRGPGMSMHKGKTNKSWLFDISDLELVYYCSKTWPILTDTGSFSINSRCED